MADDKKSKGQFEDFFDEEFTAKRFKSAEDKLSEPASISSDILHSFSIENSDASSIHDFEQASQAIQNEFSDPLTEEFGKDEPIEYGTDSCVTEIEPEKD